MSLARPSLTLRLALIFALLAFLCLACLGVALYQGLERELIRRDDAALISRVEQMRSFLSDSNTVELIKSKPALFQNMLGNREAILSIGVPGQPQLLTVNPGHLRMPPVTATALNQPLALDDVRHVQQIDGVPFAFVSAAFSSSELGTVQILAGRLMTERTAVLAGYRLRVYLLATAAALLLALCGCLLVHRGLLPLRRLARHAHGIGVGNLADRLDSQDAPRELMPMIDAFNTMLERLSRGFVQLGQVSTDMAHELRTPINNLLGETQVALQQDRTLENYQTLLASNVEELERLARMLDNMLFLARTDPASALSQRQELSAADETERMADYFEGLAADAGMLISTQGDGLIWAEPMLLRRAIANLCSNAIKYGAPDTELLIQVLASPDGTTLAVQNQGMTIAPEHLARLFERFYRVDESRQRSTESNGLGLSIVATIMRLHNGRYGVTSEQGLTRFEIFFPARSAAG